MQPLRLGLWLLLAAAARAVCPGSPWQEWRGFCYRLTYEAVPWHGVRGDCKAFFRSSDAASVTSKAENDFIRNLAGRQAVWLGMRSTDNVLYWVDGSPVSFRNFPGNRAITKGAEDVVQMAPSGRWQFAASHATGRQRGVCKMAPCRCPSGWQFWDRRCYRAVTERVSWTEARQRCRNMAPTADLVSIINERENNFVFDLLKQYPFWIGLNDRAQEGTFIWSSGENYPYRNWHKPTEPNGAGHTQDCAEMLNDKTWSDNSCHVHNKRKNPFVCELIICGRDEQILRQPVRGQQIRLWEPDDEFRCPASWKRSGDRCFSEPTPPDTFQRVLDRCARRHPQAGVALLRSAEDNDRAFFSAGTFPMWVDYGTRSGRALSGSPERLRQQSSTFTNWEPDVTLARSVDSDCAAMQASSQWRPSRCNRDRLPGLCEIPACKPACPPGWVPFEGHCYRVPSPKRTRKEAAAVCQRDGAQLASIQTQDENDFVTTLAFRSGADYSHWTSRLAWIGATRPSGAADWSWSDCTPWSLSRWHQGDGNARALTNGTCAALQYTGRWRDDVNCQAGAFTSVCELDPCKKQFGSADESGCRSGKETEVTDRPPTRVTEPPVPDKTDRFICPQDWTELNGYCYQGVSEPDTFIGALQTCTVTFSPAHVASVHSQEENRLVLALTGGGPSWLGLTAAYDFPLWRWMDGSDSESFTAWAERQPAATAANMKVCAAVNKRGRWVSRDCTRGRHRFACRLPAVRVVDSPSCPDPTTWREEAGSCYAFHRTGASFVQARQACAGLTADGFIARLPVVEDAQEDAALGRLANGHVVRLGLTNGWPDGRWRWEDGSEPGFANWLDGEPAPGQGRLCASLDGRRGSWVAQSCADAVPFYCEAVPESEDYYDDYDYGSEAI